VDGTGGGRGAVTAAGLLCGSCGTELPPDSRFCNKCAAPVGPAATAAEYKQVTVLFADVVHSMDIAAAVGPEQLREIMADLADRCAAVVQRYGGTVDKFTGDGIMAVFGAPLALEDHAFRACLAALAIQEEVKRLSVDVRDRDGVELQLRVGLNSGQVIAGEIGSGPFGYTTIGEQVGMAQRMESAAPPGGVMLSGSTARLVEGSAMLGEPQLVRIKGADSPVSARQLIAVGHCQPRRRHKSTLVGRSNELDTIDTLLEEAVDCSGRVLNISGPAGIGKSRLVHETAAKAASRAIPVFSTHCEPHESDIPFHAAARLLRAAIGVDDLNIDAARSHVRDRYQDADPDDLLLLDDFLGLRDAAVDLPNIAPDARRRRLVALINAASITRQEPAVYVIEDVHWIDAVSESMLVDFLAVIPQTPSLVLITYRPEYDGALKGIPRGAALTLKPLSDAQTLTLTAELLGSDPSVDELAERVTGRAAGNPFFAQELVRDLAERGVLQGESGAYRLIGAVTDVVVPPTLHATISARIDRLTAGAKETLSSAAVIGTRFDVELLGALVDNPDTATLIRAEMVDQVKSSTPPVYAFRHPLIRAVAYESQLKSVRAQLHRRLATAIEKRGSADAHAALIAEHLESAGDLRAAFAWHMRAGAWYNFRDITAARTSWRRAQSVADQLPRDGPDPTSMRIAPRTLLCGTAYRVGGLGAESAFAELRGLCLAAGDQRSLAIGMAGLVIARNFAAHRQEASRLASDLGRLLDSIGDSTLTVALSFAAMLAKHETAEMTDILQWAERVIDLAAGDPAKGNLILGSPLTFAIVLRGVARWSLGMSGWREELDRGTEMARDLYPVMLAGMMWRRYIFAIPYGVLMPDEAALHDTADTLAAAEQSGDDLALNMARTIRGVVLVHRGGPERQVGLDLLAETRERILRSQFVLMALPIAELHLAMERLRLADVDGAIGAAQAVAEDLFASGGTIWDALDTTVLVEALLQRGHRRDIAEAESALNRLAVVSAGRSFVPDEVSLLRLRALLARAEGDDASYQRYRDRYRARVTDLGFSGHIAMAKAMP
jgi:adenylate cyclase